MNASEVALALREAEGIIERVDVAARELMVSIDGVPRLFDLAPDCSLLLHGEPVKLRLLQAADRAQLLYAHEGEERVAYHVRVR
jgi:hypothetical protein